MAKNNFRFWFPLEDIRKGKDKEGNEVMILGGIASTERRDTDTEKLLPKGFDVSYLNERGIVNWNHGKSPEDIIGEPVKTELRAKGLYVESMLYPTSDKAKKVYALAETLKKSNSKRKLGYSIEGKALERDPTDARTVTKALITNLAITINPKNCDSFIDIIKGDFSGWDDTQAAPAVEIDFNAANGGKTTIIDITRPDGTQIIVDSSYNIVVKALNTVNGAPLIKEHVDGQEHVTCHKGEDDQLNQDGDTLVALTKAEVMQKILSTNSVIGFEKAHQIYQVLNDLTMSKNTVITDDLLEKALTSLKGDASPAATTTTDGGDLNKGEGGSTEAHPLILLLPKLMLLLKTLSKVKALKVLRLTNLNLQLLLLLLK
jgi:hypothetical protein